MVDLNPTPLTIMSNVNRLNTPIKKAVIVSLETKASLKHMLKSFTLNINKQIGYKKEEWAKI